MKILHISRTMGQGGAEKIVYQLCKDNNDIEKVVASTGGYYEEELENINVKHYKIPDIDKKNIFSMIKTFVILKKIIKKEKIDIIHTHHRMAAFYARLLSLFNSKIKLVYTAHNVFNNKKKLTRFSLKNTKIVAVGDGVKNNLVNDYGICKERITVIYNSIEVRLINENNSIIDKLNKSNKKIIGTIGRLSEQKGIDIFIKSLKEVINKNKNVFAVIIGDGEDKEKLLNLTKELNISNNIIFLGYQKNIFDIIKQLDFVVLSSRWEGFPLTPIEVFSMKKTIIASNISGNNEIVVNNENGLLFEKNNVADLTEKIDLLLTDNKLKDRLEKNAFLSFKEKFSYDVFTKNYLDLYKEIN